MNRRTLDVWPQAPVLGLAALLLIAITTPCVAEDHGATRFRDLVEREWQDRLQRDPLLATYVGVHDYDDQLPAVGLEEEAAAAAATRAFLAELEGVDPASLDATDRVSYEVFRWVLDERLRNHDVGGHRLRLTSDSGFHSAFARLPQQMRLASVADFDGYLARLRAFPDYVAGQVELLADGLAHGMTLPKVVLEGYEGTIAPHVVDRPEDSVFWAPFESFPPSVPEAEHGRLRAAARTAILEGAVAGYRTFLDFMTDTYIPGARETTGASAMPGGDDYYANRVRHYTTLDLDAETIHRMGLEEVARIRREMDAIIEGLGFEGTFADFLKFLRTDPRFYAETPEELLKEAAYISKRMDAKLPALFGRLPRQPYGVEPVPDSLAPKYTGGRYVPAPLGGKRGGTYWVNTHALESRPLYTLEALSLHEAVPGHHLQFALAQELEGVPAFRRNLYISAYGEGWGLYSERLGLEAGFYTDPYSDFGRLTYEMWRACRLVVDTGLHAMGWGRQRAIDYLAANTALSIHEVTTEIDRYISWPGQALSYKIGELEIRRLRREAEEALGADFDLRTFHDRLLGQGSVPLPVLRSMIEGWVGEVRSAPDPSPAGG